LPLERTQGKREKDIVERGETCTFSVLEKKLPAGGENMSYEDRTKEKKEESLVGHLTKKIDARPFCENEKIPYSGGLDRKGEEKEKF